jgi:ribonuclease Z
MDATGKPFRVVYSGDCRPTPALIKAGQGATILIHDATFDADLIVDARKKKHSTVPEALRVGVAMGAEYTFLSHFSAR